MTNKVLDLQLFGLRDEDGVEISADILYMLVSQPVDHKEIVNKLREKYEGARLEYAMFTYGAWIGMLSSDDSLSMAQLMFQFAYIANMIGGRKMIKEMIQKMASSNEEEKSELLDKLVGYIS